MNPPVLVPFLVFSLRITEGDRHPFLFTENPYIPKIGLLPRASRNRALLSVLVFGSET